MPKDLLKEITSLALVQIGLIILAAWLMLRFVQWFLPWLATQAPSRLRLHLLPLMPILQLVIILLAVINILSLIIYLTPENLLVASGAIAVALGFAFQDYVSSLIAGIVTIYERPYRTGDWIRIGDAYGEVTAVRFRAVELVTPDDTVVLIPHKRLWEATIFNDNNGQREHMCVANFYLHPEHDAEQVRQKLRNVALTSPYLQLNRPIAVIIQEMPWGTHYRLKAYPIDGRNQFKFTSDMTVRGKVTLMNMGVKPAIAPQAAIP